MKKSSTIDMMPFEAEDVLIALATRIRVARKARMLTQRQVALAANVSLSTMVAIEKGSPNVQIGFWVSVMWALSLTEGLASIVQSLGQQESEVALLEVQLPKRIRG